MVSSFTPNKPIYALKYRFSSFFLCNAQPLIPACPLEECFVSSLAWVLAFLYRFVISNLLSNVLLLILEKRKRKENFCSFLTKEKKEFRASGE